MDATANPLKSLWVSLRGPRTDGPMAPEISLDGQRQAIDVHDAHVDRVMAAHTAETPVKATGKACASTGSRQAAVETVQ